MKKKLLTSTGLLLIGLFLVLGASSCDDQGTASLDNATTAAQKWGASPKITNYYEYEQVMEIYQMRDDPKLILNAYVMTNNGDLKCLGKVQGFGIPYGTQQSPPNSGGTAIPEPNSLYPSQSTNADWIRIIGPDGKSHIGFIEPNMIITDLVYPCTNFQGSGHD